LNRHSHPGQPLDLEISFLTRLRDRERELARERRLEPLNLGRAEMKIPTFNHENRKLHEKLQDVLEHQKRVHAKVDALIDMIRQWLERDATPGARS
jgi:hypothetical protein